MNNRTMILQPCQFAVLNGVVYIGEDEAADYPKGRKADLQGEIFDDCTICIDGDYSDVLGMLMLVMNRLNWSDKNKVSYVRSANASRIEYKKE